MVISSDALSMMRSIVLNESDAFNCNVFDDYDTLMDAERENFESFLVDEEGENRGFAENRSRDEAAS